MPPTALRPLVAAVLLATPLPALSQPAAATTYRELEPILARHCVVCHAGEAAPLGLRLDSYEASLKGGANGPVVKSGDPAASELIRRIRGSSQPRMPMTGPPFLSDGEIELFENWVARGLPRGDSAAAAGPAAAPAPRPAPGETVTYQHVASILAARCAKCHTENGLMGPAPEGYRLTGYAATLSASDRVRVVPGKPAASELIRRIRGQARPRMPLDGAPLGDDEIRLIEAWVAQGARSTEGVAAGMPAGAAVRLHGILGPGSLLDGLPLVIDARTRIDKSPRAGDYVQVRGTLDATGQVRVDRIRRR